jgi:alcohol dehydrogenase class IV
MGMTAHELGFELVTANRIIFGDGCLGQLESLAPSLGARALLVVGGASAERSGLLARLQALLPVEALARCATEPSIGNVDAIVSEARAADCDLVVAVGGGSVLDCGKAAAGMLTNDGSLLDYLEGVGSGRTIERPGAPLIAAPTTAGTGSEVTKNAVISGDGFKKSIRSTHLLPRVALVDPELTSTMPEEVTAACGLDALTQLIEPMLSRSANPITDALALEGIRRVGQALWRAYKRPEDREARRDMALASLLGGICLANAGLGAVHGFASPLGAFLPISHGVACAALLPQVIEANLRATRGPLEQRLRRRFASVAEALCDERFDDQQQAIEVGLAFLSDLQRDLAIPRLKSFGLDDDALRATIIANARGSSMRFNPVELSDAQLDAIVLSAL